MMTVKLLRILFFLVIFTTYAPNYKSQYKSLIFPIKNIEIVNNKVVDSKILVKELEFLKQKNILFIDNQMIKSILVKFEFIEGFKVKKIYPKTVKITVIEKKPVAIYIDGKKKFYISEKGSLIKYTEFSEYTNLPLVFGKNINFSKIFDIITNTGFPMSEIKSFYYFESDRWDIVLNNEIIIKLPIKNYSKALKNFISINKDKNFEKFSSFDYRIKDQLILK